MEPIDEFVDKYLTTVRENIAKYGQHIVGVFGEPGSPMFAYTVGLYPEVGYELVVYSLPVGVAMQVLNDIGEHLRTGRDIALNEPVSTFTNVPVKFVQCGLKGQEVNGVARRYYSTGNVPMVQIVLSDRQGRFPGDPDFDHV